MKFITSIICVFFFNFTVIISQTVTVDFVCNNMSINGVNYPDGSDVTLCEKALNEAIPKKGTSTFPYGNIEWSGVINNYVDHADLTLENLTSNPVLLMASYEEEGVTHTVSINLTIESADFKFVESEAHPYGFDPVNERRPPMTEPMYDKNPWISMKKGLNETGFVIMETGEIPFSDVQLTSLNTLISVSPEQPSYSPQDLVITGNINESLAVTDKIDVQINQAGDYCIDNQLNIAFFDQKEEDVRFIIVHEGNADGSIQTFNSTGSTNFNLTTISEELSEAYRQAVFKWSPSQISDIVVDYDINNDNLLDVVYTSSNMGITEEMLLIREGCEICNSDEGDFKYIFIVGATTSASLSGDLPLLGRYPSGGLYGDFGIVSSFNCVDTPTLNRVTAHELGHSLTLRHPIDAFSPYNICDDPLNLMDKKFTDSECEFTSGNKLRKYQWSRIHLNN